jgi:HAD superfamily hydrolase (TIGR01509 family)
MFQGVIFDMDGTLIDSEPMWQQAEKSVFASVGVTISDELSAITAGMTTKAVTQFWFERQAWTGKSLQEVENQVIDRVGQLIRKNGMPMQGVTQVLDFFKARNFKIGLATNSPDALISVVMDRLGIADYFDVICSSDNELHGKPSPDVFLSAAQKMAIPVNKCIAFEDSYTGLVAALRAKMKVVVIPDNAQHSDPKFDGADLKLTNLADFSELHLSQLSS